MNKEQSTLIKGIAILLMVYLHLFGKSLGYECTNLITIGTVPFVTYFAKFASICIPLYVFLSGYGLYIQDRKVAFAPSRTVFLRRTLFFYLNFLSVCILFIPLACIVRPEYYPGSAASFFKVISLYNPGIYNGTWWFITPYILLLGIASVVIKCIERYPILLVLGCAGVLFAFKLFVAKYFSAELQSYPLTFASILCLGFLLSFCLGAYCAKYRIIELSQVWRGGVKWRSLLSVILLTGMIASRIIIDTHALDPIYVLILVLLVNNIKLPGKLQSGLRFLGFHSTNVWLVHSFFITLLFHDFFYSFKYPILIFAAAMTASLLASAVVTRIFAYSKSLITHNYGFFN